MPFKDPARKREHDRQRYQRMRRGERPNPLTLDEWRDLQRAAMRQGRGPWELLRRVAALWGVPEHW
jgi:hypothetical protein